MEVMSKAKELKVHRTVHAGEAGPAASVTQVSRQAEKEIPILSVSQRNDIHIGFHRATGS